MKKLAVTAILLAAVLLCGCAVSTDAQTTQSATESEQTQEILAEVETPVPDPTPIPDLTDIELLVDIPLNTRVLVETEEDGVYSVALHEDEPYWPTVPIYCWYINGTQADTIDEVIIEFDVLDTVWPLDGKYYGYDQAFYIILHNFDTIPAMPPWPDSYISFRRGDIDRNIMINTPEIGVDLRKYAQWDGKHVQVRIPYSEFQNASKDLTLLFLPGTTFGNLSISIWGEDGLYADAAAEISQQIEYPERDLMNEVIEPLFTTGMEPFPVVSNTAAGLNNRIHGGCFQTNKSEVSPAMNPDGSVDMPVAFYDLGEDASQVTGKYAVIPEGIAPTLAILKGYGCFTYEQMEQFVDFVVGTMMSESGQFYGIYDLEQQKLVATDRKAAALPILSELASFRNLDRGEDGCFKLVSDDVVDLVANAIIADDIVRVGDTLYYAPYGIGEDGVMNLKLSDFVFTESLFVLLAEYSCDENRLDEKYGCAMLLEGVANSLKLILEGQEQNATRLPSTELRVVFSGDGETYELQPSDTFDINNSYFSIGLPNPSFTYPRKMGPGDALRYAGKVYH